MHLSEENLSQLLCEEECGSIPDPELYCHFSGHGKQPGAAYQSPTLLCCTRSCCSVTVCFGNISTQPLPPLAKPRQSGGRDVHRL